MSLPGNIGLLARWPNPATNSQFGNVDGPASSTDNAVVRWDGATGRLIQNSTVIMTDNGDISVPSTATLGLQLYNTADVVTNYERLGIKWASNVATIGTARGGTGTNRVLRLNNVNAVDSVWAAMLLDVQANPRFTFGLFTTETGTAAGSTASTGYFVSIGNFTNTVTSGTTGALSITPTYNQASGTAANTDNLSNRTETAIGSGRQMLHDWQIGGNSIAGITRVGSALYANTNTSQGEATSAVKKLRSITTISDNVATNVFTVTVPNAAHSATIRVTFSGSLGAGGAIGANEATGSISYDFSVARTAGVNAVVGASSAYGSSTAAVAGAATITVTGAASAVSGAVGATNTFTIQVTIARGSGSSDNHTCRATAEIINANATGITIQ